MLVGAARAGPEEHCGLPGDRVGYLRVIYGETGLLVSEASCSMADGVSAIVREDSMTSTWQERYLERYYDRSAGWIGGTEEFHRMCQSVAPMGGRILEIGSGPTNPTSRFLSTLGELHGVDIGREVLENDALVSASVLDSPTYPMKDESFALCVSNYVLEHVSDPDAHFSEVWRVLKPGGAYCFRTPNRYHYVTAVARLTPHWFHVLVANRLRNRRTDAADTYPTFYAVNSQSDVRRIATQSGFEVEELVLIEKEPSYGMSSRLLFLTFLAYERLVNSTELAANLRVNIFAVLRKPARLAH